MSIQIKLKNSVVQDSTPSASDLPEVGELAVNGNINSIGGFMRASDNSIVKIFGPGSVTTPTATTTVSGISELATNSETTTGTATNRVVTPAGLNAVTVAERTTSNTNYVAKAGSTLTGVLTMPNGSNSAPAINFGDSDSGIFGGTNTVSLAAGGTTRLTADTGVSVVGTLAVQGALTTTQNLTIAEKVIHSGDTDTFVSFPAANTVSVETGGNEALRVNSSGHLLVGSSTSVDVGSSAAAMFQIEHSGSNLSAALYSTINATGPAGVLALGHARGSASGILLDDDVMGQVRFAGGDGVDLETVGAQISAEVDGTPGANDMPGRLVFSTTADGAASPTTRLTIDSAGLVKIPDNGKFVAGDSSDLQIFHDGSNSIVFENGTGTLKLATAGASVDIVKGSDSSETMAKFIINGACELYHDNSKKLETTSAGVAVTGSVSPTGNINLVDSSSGSVGRVRFGAGADLQIYHDGSNSIIQDSGTGELRLDSNTLRIRNAAGTETSAVFVEDGACEFRFDNSKKFETHTNGVTVTGRILVSGNSGVGLIHGDSVKAVFGDSDDLQIYHNGTHSFIQDTGTGNLEISSSKVAINNAANNANMATFTDGGAVELYHNGNKKIETTSAGVTVTGQVGADGLNVSGSAFFHGNVDLHDNDILRIGTGDDLQIYHDGSNSYIANTTGTVQLTSTGITTLKGTSVTFENVAGNENILRAFQDGAVELYYDGSKKFETTSWGAQVTGALKTSGGGISIITDSQKFTAGAGDDLQIYHNGSHSVIQNDTGTLFSLADSVIFKNNANSETIARFIADGNVELYHNNVKRFETTSTGVQAVRYSFDSDNYITCNTSANTMEFVTNSTDIGEFSPSGLMLRDNMELRLGTGNDLRLYHDGNDSVIKDAGTGRLSIQTSHLQVANAANSETILNAFENGAVELYHDNSKKFETTSTGATVTGTLKVDTIQNTSAAHSSTTQQIAEGRAKAWVQWNSDGTLSIYDSFNISSVSDDGVGQFTVNIDTNMANANYVVVGSSQGEGSPNGSHNLIQIHSKHPNDADDPTAGSFQCCVVHPPNNVKQDCDRIMIVVFGDQ